MEQKMVNHASFCILGYSGRCFISYRTKSAHSEGFCVYECPDGDDFCGEAMFLALQISWVMVPIGQ